MKAVLAIVLAAGVGTALGAQSSSQQSSTVQPKDQPFLETIAHDNHAEIELAQLVQQKAQSADVKQFAQRLEGDHKQAQQQLEQVAQQAGVTLPAGLTDDQQTLKHDLSQASGQAFDRQYLHAMVSGHMAAIAVLHLEAQQGDYKPASDFAKNAIPTIQSHLDRAKQLAEQVEKHSATSQQ